MRVFNKTFQPLKMLLSFIMKRNLFTHLTYQTFDRFKSVPLTADQRSQIKRDGLHVLHCVKKKSLISKKNKRFFIPKRSLWYAVYTFKLRKSVFLTLEEPKNSIVRDFVCKEWKKKRQELWYVYIPASEITEDFLSKCSYSPVEELISYDEDLEVKGEFRQKTYQPTWKDTALLNLVHHGGVVGMYFIATTGMSKFILYTLLLIAQVRWPNHPLVDLIQRFL